MLVSRVLVHLLTWTVFLYRTAIPIVNGISSTLETHSCALSLSDAQIIDVKFLTPTLLLILVSKGTHSPSALSPYPPPFYLEEKLTKQDSTPTLISLPLTNPLPWAPHTGPAPPSTPIDPSSAASTPVPVDDDFSPVRMDVHNASDARGPLPARVCLLGKDRCTYRVFELEVS